MCRTTHFPAGLVHFAFLEILPRQLQFWRMLYHYRSKVPSYLQGITLWYPALCSEWGYNSQHITVLFQQKHAHDTNHGQQSSAGSQLTFIMTSYPAEDGFQYSMELFVGDGMICQCVTWSNASIQCTMERGSWDITTSDTVYCQGMEEVEHSYSLIFWCIEVLNGTWINDLEIHGPWS